LKKGDQGGFAECSEVKRIAQSQMMYFHRVQHTLQK
jgi:hypothetical protein